MSEENNKNDIFANNNGVIKSWKGLAAVIVVFVGYLALLGVLSAIPSLQWLAAPLFGLLFFVTGLIFLAMSNGSYNAPLFAMMIGTVLMFVSLSDKFVPSLRESIGSKGEGAIVAAFGVIMIICPFAVTGIIKARYNETVNATVAYVERHFSRSRKGHHAYTYRTTYEFTFEGKTYEVKDKLYTSGDHPATGEERELRINPDNPEKFYNLERLKSKSPASFIFPVILLALGIYLMVA